VETLGSSAFGQIMVNGSENSNEKTTNNYVNNEPFSSFH